MAEKRMRPKSDHPRRKGSGAVSHAQKRRAAQAEGEQLKMDFDALEPKAAPKKAEHKKAEHKKAAPAPRDQKRSTAAKEEGRKKSGGKAATTKADPAKHRRAKSMETAAELAPGKAVSPKKGKAAHKKGKSTTHKKGRSAAAKRRQEQRRRLYGMLSLAFATGIAAMALLGVYLIRQHSAFEEMKRVVENQTFYNGTTVEGVDVSDMTLAAAREYWTGVVEPSYSQRTVTLDDGATLTAQDMGYLSEYDSVLYNAWSAGRSGSLEERYHAAVSSEASPAAYKVRRRLYSDEAVAAYAQGVAEAVDKPVLEPTVQGFDTETYKFTFTEAQAGSRLDAEALKSDIEAALNAGGGSVTRQIETLNPRTTDEQLTSEYGAIATAITNASSSTSNRLDNIRQALSYINGYCLEPGETFSFNGVVGKRTTARGFKLATAYSSGDVTKEVGGGICQVSTTLFNAAVKSDLKIVERHNHSLTVHYVDSGKDATVNWDSQDLRFKNTTGDRIYICCYLTKDKRVRVGIFGRKLPAGESITVEAHTTQVIKYDTKYEPDRSLPFGETKVVSSGKNGCKAVAYKVRWDADGNEISREVLCKSSYKAKSQVVAVGV